MVVVAVVLHSLTIASIDLSLVVAFLHEETFVMKL
jgi:hypothetical protein